MFLPFFHSIGILWRCVCCFCDSCASHPPIMFTNRHWQSVSSWTQEHVSNSLKKRESNRDNNQRQRIVFVFGRSWWCTNFSTLDKSATSFGVRYTFRTGLWYMDGFIIIGRQLIRNNTVDWFAAAVAALTSSTYLYQIDSVPSNQTKRRCFRTSNRFPICKNGKE